MASSTTPIPATRAAWTASGACTSGSTAPPGDATRPAWGGAVTTNTTSGELKRGDHRRNRGTGALTTHGVRPHVLRRLGAALGCQRGADRRRLCVDVGDGRDGDARRVDDVDGVDADVRTDVARGRGVVPRYVGRDDDGDDAAVAGPHVVALSLGRGRDERDAPRSADRARGLGLLLRVGTVRTCGLPSWRRAGDNRDGAAGAGAHR